MAYDLVQYFSQFTALTQEEIEFIKASGLVRSYPSGTVLIKEGQIPKECYLVLKGCVRSYYLEDGEEHTSEFYTENQPIPSISYTNQTPSTHYLICLEDSILSLGSPEKTKEVLASYPKFAAVFHQIGSQLMAQQSADFGSYRHLSPEERYLKLLETRPDLIQRVPQYQLASYLGMKPQSLSRIRKRISTDQ